MQIVSLFLAEPGFEAGEIEKEIRMRYPGRLALPSDGGRVAVE